MWFCSLAANTFGMMWLARFLPMHDEVVESFLYSRRERFHGSSHDGRFRVVGIQVAFAGRMDVKATSVSIPGKDPGEWGVYEASVPVHTSWRECCLCGSARPSHRVAVRLDISTRFWCTGAPCPRTLADINLVHSEVCLPAWTRPRARDCGRVYNRCLRRYRGTVEQETCHWLGLDSRWIRQRFCLHCGVCWCCVCPPVGCSGALCRSVVVPDGLAPSCRDSCHWGTEWERLLICQQVCALVVECWKQGPKILPGFGCTELVTSGCKSVKIGLGDGLWKTIGFVRVFAWITLAGAKLVSTSGPIISWRTDWRVAVLVRVDDLHRRRFLSLQQLSRFGFLRCMWERQQQQHRQKKHPFCCFCFDSRGCLGVP